MSCFEAFQKDFPSGEDRQKFIDEKFPNFECEACSVSSYSPGPVDSAERLAFLIIHPIHFDEKLGTLVPTAFDQLLKHDLSVIRVEHSKKLEVDSTIERLIERGRSAGNPHERRINMACTVEASRLREATDSIGRVFGVYDTALEASPAHASVFTRKDMLEGRSARKRIRLRIFELFAPRLGELAAAFPE